MLHEKFVKRVKARAVFHLNENVSAFKTKRRVPFANVELINKESDRIDIQ